MKSFILIIFLITGYETFAQVKYVNIFHTPNSSKNLIYSGLTNPIEFTDKKFSKMDLKFFTDNGKIRIDSGKYYLNAIDSEDQIKLKAFSYHGKDSSLIYVQTFRVAKTKDPVLQINNRTIDFFKTVKTFSKLELTNNNVRCIIPDCEKWTDILHFEIVYFELEFPKGLVLSSFDSNFTKDMKNNIELLKSNTKIVISQVKTKGPDGSVRSSGGGYIMIRN
jgi:hypothetical protein